jgi:hypothetical protein
MTTSDTAEAGTGPPDPEKATAQGGDSKGGLHALTMTTLTDAARPSTPESA